MCQQMPNNDAHSTTNIVKHATRKLLNIHLHWHHNLQVHNHTWNRQYYKHMHSSNRHPQGRHFRSCLDPEEVISYSMMHGLWRQWWWLLPSDIVRGLGLAHRDFCWEWVSPLRHLQLDKKTEMWSPPRDLSCWCFRCSCKPEMCTSLGRLGNR